MLLTDKVSVRWSGSNRKYYEDKGYKFTSYKDSFDVDVNDLNPNSHAEVKVKCDICGHEGQTNYKRYMKDIITNDGGYVCQPCSVQVRHDKQLEKRRDDYMTRLITKCAERGYVLLSDRGEITGNTSTIRYLCPAHGEQSMRIANMLFDKGCPQCAIEARRNMYQLNTGEIIKRVDECGGIIVNPEDYINQSTRNLKFVCRECGGVFVSTLQRFTQHGGQVCPSCSNNESIGEKRIRYYLEENGIDFIPQKWFHDCRDVKPLPFDFYLPESNTLIEFDGRQHFEETDWFTYSFEETKKHDEIKNAYCVNKGINIIRIPYDKINDIEEILSQKILA